MRGGTQRKITSYFKGRKRRTPTYFKSRTAKRSRYSGRAIRRRRYGGSDTRIPQQALVANTISRRVGPYRSPNYVPTIKGTQHRAETVYWWNSSTVGATNNVAFIINQWGSAYKNQSGTLSGTTAYIGTFDSYAENGQNAPYGITKCFQKATSVRLDFTNNLESNCSVRVTFAKLRRYRVGTLSAQWNGDIRRPLATRHWKILKSETFIMEPATYTAATTPAGATRCIKKYYFPENKWRYTNTADPSTNGGSWDLRQYAPHDAIYMFVDTDDATSADSEYITVFCNINDYFHTVDATAA